MSYVCSGDSCCLVPNYLIPKNTKKECENYSICFNQIDKDYEFCKDCLELPYENKKRIIEKAECSLCSKKSNITVRREECEHTLCVNCFRKCTMIRFIGGPSYSCLILGAVPLLVCGFAALCDVLAAVPLVVSDGLLQLRRLGAVPLS